MIPHSRPYFDHEDEQALCRVLRRRFVTYGEEAEKLGRLGASIVGKAWGIAVQSGTDALTAALKVLGVGKGDLVALPSYLCSAPLDALSILSAEPLLVDINRDKLFLDFSAPKLKQAKAVIAPHLFGIPGPVDKLVHPLVIEDCAQTLGVKVNGRPVGSFGILAVLSFYGTKLVATGHGGLLAGRDFSLKEKALALFSHDKREEWTPHFHFFMSDLAAALGCAQLSKLPRFLTERRRIAAEYAEALGASSLLKECAYFRFLVVTEELEDMAGRFLKAGIEAKRPVYKPLHLLLGKEPEEFPNSQWAHDHILSVPIYPGMSREEVKKIAAFLREHAHALRCWPPS